MYVHTYICKLEILSTYKHYKNKNIKAIVQKTYKVINYLNGPYINSMLKGPPPKKKIQESFVFGNKCEKGPRRNNLIHCYCM